jgi:hypothetical protein
MRRLTFVILLTLVAFAQDTPERFPKPEDDPKLPNGTSQRQAIIKAEHKRSVEDAAKLEELASEVHADLDKGDANIVSLKTLKQLDEIEKLTKAIRGRLKRI